MSAFSYVAAKPVLGTESACDTFPITFVGLTVPGTGAMNLHISRSDKHKSANHRHNTRRTFMNLKKSGAEPAGPRDTGIQSAWPNKKVPHDRTHRSRAWEASELDTAGMQLP